MARAFHWSRFIPPTGLHTTLNAVIYRSKACPELLTESARQPEFPQKCFRECSSRIIRAGQFSEQPLNLLQCKVLATTIFQESPQKSRFRTDFRRGILQ